MIKPKVKTSILLMYVLEKCYKNLQIHECVLAFWLSIQFLINESEIK